MIIKYKNVCVVLAATLLVTACSDSGTITEKAEGDEETSEQDQLGSHIPHTGPADGIWPPQLQDISNIQPYPASARAGALAGVLSAARSSIINNPQVRSALGSDYQEIEATLGDIKSDSVATLVFYNYTNNETIVATLAGDGSSSTEVMPASAYQPMEHPEEQLDAIALAQAALTSSSYDVSGLQATAMLAFPPQRNIQNVDEQFYDQRVLYVTFGPGSGALPVYTALVDISSASVIEHGLVK